MIRRLTMFSMAFARRCSQASIGTPTAGVLVLLLASLAAAAAEPPAKDLLKVATFNINWGNPDLGAIVEVIRQSQADVMALQETNADSERALRQRLKADYRHMHFRGPAAGRPAGGFGFLAKFPLEEFTYLEPKAGLFGTWICHVRVAGRKVQLVNVHLQPFLLPEKAGTLELVQMLGRVEQTHAEEIRQIGRALAKDMPVIVLGDLNSPSPLDAPQYLIKQGFTDSFASVTRQPDEHPTWHWRFEKLSLKFRLDYIFHRGGISTLESRIIPTTASDHYLVLSKLRIAAQQEKP